MQVIQEIESARERLQISPNDFYQIPPQKGREVFQKSLEAFVKSGHRRWWWEDFRQEAFEFQPQKRPFEMVSQLIPPDTDKVWFIAEDTEEPFFPVYRVRPELISAVIGECFGFEYYVVDLNFRWLLCETHHHRLLGVGDLLKNYNDERIIKE